MHPRPPCQHAYHAGERDRTMRPLPSGQYKLRELWQDLEACREKLVRIRNIKSAKSYESSSGRSRCTPADQYRWLKRLPCCVAYKLGYNLLPGLRALIHDGKRADGIEDLYPRLDKRVGLLIADFEQARRAISRQIGVEYERMRCGDPMLEPLLERAMELVEDALLLIP